MTLNRSVPLFALAAVTAFGCVTERQRTVETKQVESHSRPYAGPRHAIVVGTFKNKSPYMRGIFSDGGDRLGTQAKTILKTHLTQTRRFDLMDREAMAAAAEEAKLAGIEQKISGASALVTGEVTEFGRRQSGDKQLFGIVGKGKSQLAYAKVSVLIVDVRTSQVLHSVQGAGEFELNSRQVLGTGSTTGYDATLNGKVLNLAITDAVNKLVQSLEAGEWNPTRSR